MLALYLPILISQAILLNLWGATISAYRPVLPRRKQAMPTIILME